MNIYRVSQEVNRQYDTYDAMVVAASDEEDAKSVTLEETDGGVWHDWADRADLIVELVGVAADDVERGVILASYIAG